ncbi:TetR/AcrR family transcriptional regulator [Salsuginibacillus kocurii]|uniref:TetR/AcrR family transcriptional regulator n=1 Tax=Salsuginibacillus kocurii TaxID=427078 RepID=UPI000368871C|nr:TetR/AcrR family transcriptional regulator [Salsuginibacillus kocurii]
MNDKETVILEEAIKLFSVKGFAGTSIQEISKESGIAKGTVYLHFQSKEQLIIAAYDYYFDQMFAQIEKVKEKKLEAREQFIEQITVFFESVIAHQEFIVLQANDYGASLNESLKKLALQKQREISEIFIEGIVNIYGPDIMSYRYDLATMLEGMLRSYMRLVFLGEQRLDLRHVVSYLVNRIDDLVKGLKESTEAPILTELQMKHVRQKVDTYKENPSEIIARNLEKIKNIVQQSTHPNESYLISLQVIEEELASKYPRAPVIEGMLSNFKTLKQAKGYVQEIKTVVKSDFT